MVIAYSSNFSFLTTIYNSIFVDKTEYRLSECDVIEEPIWFAVNLMRGCRKHPASID